MKRYDWKAAQYIVVMFRAHNIILQIRSRSMGTNAGGRIRKNVKKPIGGSHPRTSRQKPCCAQKECSLRRSPDMRPPNSSVEVSAYVHIGQVALTLQFRAA